MKAVGDCQAILSNRFGYALFAELENRGILPVSDLSTMPTEQAIRLVTKRTVEIRAVPPPLAIGSTRF